MARGNPKNFDPVRSNDEATKRGRNGGIKSGEVRREKAAKNKADNERLEKLLSRTPNMEIFLESGANRKSFDMMGLTSGDIDDIETLTDLTLILAALKGDLKAKKYLDERRGKSPALELKRRELELKERMVEAEEGAKANAAVDDWITPLEG